MLRPDSKAVPIPAGFRPLIQTAAGAQWFVKYNHDRHGNIIGREFAMYQDVEPLLDHNGRMMNQNDGWSVEGREKGDKLLRRAASVPFALIEKWKAEEGWDYLNPDHADKARQKLNDIDYRKLRTAHWSV